MRSRSIAVVLVTALGVLALHSPGEAKSRFYSVQTSAPDGLAVCTFTGSVENADGARLRLKLRTDAGEARVTVLPFFSFDSALEVGAGVEPLCDIFDPDDDFDTDSVRIRTDEKLPFFGIVEIHSHPDGPGGCLLSDEGAGRVTLQLRDQGDDDVLKFSRLTCASDPAFGNLFPLVNHPGRLRRATRQRIVAMVRNAGPGDATNAIFRVRLAEALLLDMATYTASKGTCRLVRVGGGPLGPEAEPLGATTTLFATDFICDLGNVPAHHTATVEFDLIPALTGLVTTTYRTNAANAGDLAQPIAIDSQVRNGSSAILRVKVKAKAGSSGTVNISPPGTDCTAPDPQNPATLSTQCIEIYGAQTTVTLTATAGTGQFDEWGDDCAGTAGNVCTIVVDPNANPPDKNVKAKFKP